MLYMNRLTKDQIIEVASLFESGMLVKDIATKYGVTYNAIKRLLQRRGATVTNTYHKLSSEDKAKAVELYNSGWSSIKIASYLNVSKPTILGLFKRRNVDTRKIIKLGANQELEICKLYESGLTSRKLASDYNVSDVTILNVLKRYKLQRRHPNGVVGNLITDNITITYPDLISEWHSNKNLPLTPERILPKSNKVINWICAQQHEWKDTVAHRTSGVDCPYCANKRVSDTNNLLVKFPEIAAQWHPTKNGNLTPKDVIAGSGHKYYWLCSNGHDWITTVSNRTSLGTGCPGCAWTHTNLERFIEEKLNINKFDKFYLGYKPDFELIQDQLYMNCDGLYFHSEVKKEDNSYHFKLSSKFHEAGLRILQFYEDEVYNKWSIVESIINNVLGKSKYIINARACEIKNVLEADSNEFYNINHLMGSITGASHFGLYYKNELVSVISVKNFNDYLEISRFCSKLNTNLRGGFQKLLAHVEKLYKPSKVISFCDLRYATGRSYELAGFNLENIAISWCWTDGKQRFNRRQCRAANGKSQNELSAELGWYKLFDAGQAKYVKKLG